MERSIAAGAFLWSDPHLRANIMKYVYFFRHQRAFEDTLEQIRHYESPYIPLILAEARTFPSIEEIEVNELAAEYALVRSYIVNTRFCWLLEPGERGKTYKVLGKFHEKFMCLRCRKFKYNEFTTSDNYPVGPQLKGKQLWFLTHNSLRHCVNDSFAMKDQYCFGCRGFGGLHGGFVPWD